MAVRAEMIVKLLIAALTFDNRGHGETEGDLGPGVTDDIEALARMLAGRPEVDGRRIAVRGSSMGGLMAIHAGVASDYVAAVIAICPAAELPEDLAPDWSPSRALRWNRVWISSPTRLVWPDDWSVRTCALQARASSTHRAIRARPQPVWQRQQDSPACLRYAFPARPSPTHRMNYSPRSARS